MKKLFSLILFALIAIGVSGCTIVSPDAGQEAVLIDKPVLFGSGGVRLDDVRTTGLTYAWATTDKVYVDVTPQTIPVRFDDFSSSDNILLDFETQIQYRITGSAKLLSGFGTEWFKNNVANQYAAIVRDQVKRYDMTSMMSDSNTAAMIDNEVTRQVRELMAEHKIPVEVINITLGKAKPNPNVLDQMNETAAQQQRAKTLREATAAEEQRKAEQLAKAEADNAYRQKMGLTPEMYLAREIAELNANACVNAKGGCYVIPSGTNVIAK